MSAYAGLFTKAAEGMARAGGFGETERWRFDWELAYSTHEWLDLVPTSGGHNQFGPAKLQELLAGLGAAIDAVGATSPCSMRR